MALCTGHMSPELIEARLKPINWLAEQTGSFVDLGDLTLRENRAYRMHEHYSVLPTIGCEIEVAWSAFFPELADRYFGQTSNNGTRERTYNDLSVQEKQDFTNDCTRQELDIKLRLEAVKNAGIPKGKDSYWEFAQRPTYDWRILALETELLMDAGLVPPGRSHALHVTLGGAAPGNSGMSYVLSGVELVCGSPYRIKKATHPTNGQFISAWATKGDDGILERSGCELQLSQVTGTELRSLDVSSTDQIKSTLELGQVLTSMLMARRCVKESGKDSLSDLANLWPDYCGALKKLWRDSGLPIASWGPPHRRPQPWLVWADCLGRRDTPGSAENETVQTIKSLAACAITCLDDLEPA